MPFEINIPPLAGQITNAYITEVGGVTPINVINANQDFAANLEWQLCGFLVQFLSGHWRIRLLLESMGPTEEYSLPLGGKTVPLPNGVVCPGNPNCTCWETDIPVTAGTVEPGLYKAVIALTYESVLGVPGPMAGFAELGMVQIYA